MELYKADDIENVENSIIIKGLELDSGTSVRKDDPFISEGYIIYDNSFFHLPVKENITPNRMMKDSINRSKRDHRTKRLVKPSTDLIAKLKNKDKRWHLSLHKIKRGENLWVISKKYETDHKLIIRINGIKNPDCLNIGNTILIPNKRGIQYKVKRGDTLIRISKRYKADIKIIISHNKIKKDKIICGDLIFIPDAVKRKINNPKKKYEKLIKTQITENQKDIEFQWPLKGRITSAFGKRVDPISRRKRFHCGVDIRASEGTPVKASSDGKVIFSQWKQGYGKVVVIKHRKGYITVYAHNKKNIAKENDIVKKGDMIALSGMTGAVTGPHLHFEIRKYLTPLNPLRFLK